MVPAVLAQNDKHERTQLMETKEYTIRVQGNRAFTYGLGEIVAPGITSFAAGFYDLTKEELNAKLKSLGKVTLR